MVEGSRLFSRSVSVNVPSTWSFFLMPEIPKGNLYLQDTVHLLDKLRTRILKHSNLISFGTSNAGVSHIQYVYDHIPKDQHGLKEQFTIRTNKIMAALLRLLHESMLVERCL